MTKAHSDRIKQGGEDHGYSIRVGKTLPQGAVNLAYVHNKPTSPEANLLITDLSGDIVENTVRNPEDVMVYPDETFLLRALNAPFESNSRDIELTDEFSIPLTPQDRPYPLYYEVKVAGLFDARGALLVPYPGGYVDQPIVDGLDYSQVKNTADEFLYLGGKIRVTKLDGTPIPSTYRYKIKLIKHVGAGVPADACKIVVYTNFTGTNEDTYVVRYERYNPTGTHTADYVEILNAYTFFSSMTKAEVEALAENPKDGSGWKSELMDKKFLVTQNDNHKWEVYAPSQVIVADSTSRPSHQFQYKIRGRLRTKFNSNEPGSINIGVVYINESIFGAEDLTSIVEAMYKHDLKPPYLDFENPHHPYVNQVLTDEQLLEKKQTAQYWTVDLSMPSDYLNDYDLIIITGYGAVDMALYNDSLRNYLENGGRLWIDNAGTGTSALSISNFLTNITFSTTQSSSGIKGYGITNPEAYPEYSVEIQATRRLYNLNTSNLAIGYPGITPKIQFGTGESASLWATIVRYSNGNEPCVIKRTIYSNGALIVSNCGMFRSISRPSEDIKLAMNMILAVAEEKTVHTPWLKDYVYHRDNLFKEEYKNGNHDVYVDDRNDNDSTQIVAKKILNPTVRDALIPFMPSSYYKAKGVFTVEVRADTEINLLNKDFEVGTYDNVSGAPVTSWTEDGMNVIPGWNTSSTAPSVLFEHVSNVTQRGTKAVKATLASSGTATWWRQVSNLAQGTYKVTAWVKTVNASGNGANIAVYKDNILIGNSQVMIGTLDWTKIEVTVGLTAAGSIDVGIGFNIASTGEMWIDSVAVVAVGSVYMTPESDGTRALYAYAVRPKGDIFDLKREGFTSSDVTVFDPPRTVQCVIRSFVYKWNNSTTRYDRVYGNYVKHIAEVRKSDGFLSLGAMTALVPALKVADENGNHIAEWADKTKIFFEVGVEDTPSQAGHSNFVNIGIFNTNGGRYFYSETGENVIGYEELYSDTNPDDIVVQIWTNYYTIRATKRIYSARINDSQRVYLAVPGTIDNRDNWHLRIHKGGFVKSELSYREYDAFKSFYEGKRFGVHTYELPEYERQVFKPSYGFRRVRKEICEYVNDTTVRVQNAPLYVNIGQSRNETISAIDSNMKIFKAANGDWAKTFVPKVYMDTAANGVFIEITSGYDIDTINGIVILDNPATGVVKVSYDYSNLEVFKRIYTKRRVKMERLTPMDGGETSKMFASTSKNWMMSPTPVLYKQPYGSSEKIIIPVNTYTINYDEGTILFKDEVSDRVFADYNATNDKQIIIKDYDAQNGLIHLASSITFKDELYVNYYYVENFVEYRGYYDEDLGKFLHLDLNPNEGHYSTFPTYHTEPDGTQIPVRYDLVPSSKLMNKEVYVYLVPHKSTTSSVVNQYTIRHCFSKSEWDKIQRTQPGIALLLGVVQLREHVKVEDTVVLDTRVRGGGLKASITKEMIKKRQPQSLSNWDIGPWDGAAYYKNGVVIIQLPRAILQSAGGQFTEKQVEDIVGKYIAYGVYYIVEYLSEEELGNVRHTIFLQGASFPNTLNK